MEMAGGARARSEWTDEGAAAMIGEGGEWIWQWRNGRVRVLERKGLDVRLRVWLKLKDFNVSSDEIADAFIFNFLFHSSEASN